MHSNDVKQLRMVWPESRLHALPERSLATGYAIRTYRPGDESRFYQLMELVGWKGWNDERLSYSLNQILPDGWFMVLHEASGVIVASAMALHNYKGTYPFWGELGWLVADPDHSGRELGMAVAAQVVRRFVDAGYRLIHLHTEDFRLAALKSYLKLGFVPWIDGQDIKERWQRILEQLNWPVADP